MRFLTWPNAVSALRFPLAAAFIAVDSAAARAVILAIAALSDWLDGWLARRFGQSSRSGELLDPLADKTFVVAALATFAFDARVQWWGLAILLSRDIFAVLAFAIATLRRWPIRFRARFSGKVVTVLQIGAVLGFLVRPDFAPAFVAVVGLGSAYAIYDYGAAGIRALRRTERAA